MPQSNIDKLSSQLCELLGANASEANVNNIAAVLSEIVGQITVDHSKTCNSIVREHVGHDSALARQITEDITAQRKTLVANLSAMR